MANIDIEVAGRRYNVACRDGEEQHLHSVAAMVDQSAQRATEALGTLTESRHLLFAALLMADDIKEMRAGAGLADPPPPAPDPAVAQALERLAARIESLADTLERSSASA